MKMYRAYYTRNLDPEFPRCVPYSPYFSLLSLAILRTIHILGEIRVFLSILPHRFSLRISKPYLLFILSILDNLIITRHHEDTQVLEVMEMNPTGLPQLFQPSKMPHGLETVKSLYAQTFILVNSILTSLSAAWVITFQGGGVTTAYLTECFLSIFPTFLYLPGPVIGGVRPQFFSPEVFKQT